MKYFSAHFSYHSPVRVNIPSDSPEAEEAIRLMIKAESSIMSYLGTLAPEVESRPAYSWPDGSLYFLLKSSLSEEDLASLIRDSLPRDAQQLSLLSLGHTAPSANTYGRRGTVEEMFDAVFATFFFGLIQVCPDRAAAETLNIGVVVFASHDRKVRYRNIQDFTRVLNTFSRDPESRETLLSQIESGVERLMGALGKLPMEETGNWDTLLSSPCSDMRTWRDSSSFSPFGVVQVTPLRCTNSGVDIDELLNDIFDTFVSIC